MEVHVGKVTRNATVALVLAGWLAAAGMAEMSTHTVVVTPGQQVRGQRLGAKVLPLSLSDAVRVALEHNINLEISRLGAAQARQGVLAAAGVFDSLADVSFTESSAASPATNVLQGARVSESKRRTLGLSLGALLPTGAQTSVSLDTTRAETNSQYYFLNPYWNTGLSFSFSQPLLKGFGTDVNRAAIEVARRNREISSLQFEQIVIGTVQQVEVAYWNLVYQRDNLEVKRQSLALAQDLLEQTRIRVRVGTSAPIDIVQSEATVAAREQEIIVAENQVQEAADLLKQLLGFESPEDWESEIVPTDSLHVVPEPVDLGASIAAALERRVELKQQALDQEIRAINLLTAANATKPTLNLSVGYGWTGVNSVTEVGPDGQPQVRRGDLGDAFGQLVDRDYRQWSAGLALRYNLGNHTAKAQLAQRRFELASARERLAAERQLVILEVRRAVRALQDSAKSIAAAEKARELAERNLDAEQKKFANGMSTNFQVLKIQEDLAAAQAAELRARVTYRQATAAYHVAQGDLLATMGIGIAAEEAVPEPHTFLKDVKWLKYGHWATVGDEVTAAPPTDPAKVEEEP